MEKVLNAITDFYVKKNYISEKDREIYYYGFQLILSDIINFSLIIILGALLRSVVDSIVYLFAFCIIRVFSGGFHAKTFWKCRCTMMFTFISVFVLSRLDIYNIYVCSAINIIAVGFIGVFAPIKHPNKELSDKERKRNKISAVIASFIFSVISIILFLLNMKEGVTISITLIAIIILMIIGHMTQKGGKENV